MTFLIRLAVSLLAVLCLSTLAHAEDVGFFKPIPGPPLKEVDRAAVVPTGPPAQIREADGIYLSREEAADLFGREAQRRTLEQQVQEKDTEIGALRKIIELKDQIAELQEQKYQKQVELTELAEKKAQMYADQVADVRKDAKSKVREARILGFAGAGAGMGTVIMPGIGTAVGGGVGALIGWLSTLGADGP